jgi:hypothetical protein
MRYGATWLCCVFMDSFCKVSIPHIAHLSFLHRVHPRLGWPACLWQHSKVVGRGWCVHGTALIDGPVAFGNAVRGLLWSLLCASKTWQVSIGRQRFGCVCLRLVWGHLLLLVGSLLSADKGQVYGLGIQRGFKHCRSSHRWLLETLPLHECSHFCGRPVCSQPGC